MKTEIGKTYNVKHSRKGSFVLKVTGISDDWVDGEITEGKTTTMMPYNTAYKGDTIRIRESFCKFESV